MSERSELIFRLGREKGFREAYVRSKVSTNIASQVRALRRREDLTQSEFAALTEMKQSRISAMEKPDARLSIETLVRIAAAMKMGLIVRFSSFSDMLRWENQFNQDTFRVANLASDSEFTRWPRTDTQRRRSRVRRTSARQIAPAIRTEQQTAEVVGSSRVGNALESTASPQAQWKLPFNVMEIRSSGTLPVPELPVKETGIALRMASVGGNYGQ